MFFSGGTKDDEDDVTSLGLMGVDQAVLHSIETCGECRAASGRRDVTSCVFVWCFPASDDVKRRMLSCILVVGGGLMFPMAHSWLQHLLWTQMPPKFRLQVDAQEVITRPKVR